METALTMYTDGGSRGNPGPSACAFWIPSLQMGQSAYFPKATNNEAEYEGLILALLWAKARKIKSVRHKADSKLVVNQVNRVWSVKMPHLEALRDRVDDLLSHFEEFSTEYVPRSQNFEADRLCNECMDAAENSDSTGFFM